MYHHMLGPWWIIVAVIGVIPFWRLCVRVGYSPWLSLLVLLPIANLIFIYYLAFSDWPGQRPGGTPGGTSPTPH